MLDVVPTFDTESDTLPEMFDSLLLWLGNLLSAYGEAEIRANASTCPSLAEFLDRVLSTIDSTMSVVKKAKRASSQLAILSRQLDVRTMTINRMKLSNVFAEHGTVWNEFLVLSGIRSAFSHSVDVYSARMFEMSVLVDLYNDYFLDNYAEIEPTIYACLRE